MQVLLFALNYQVMSPGGDEGWHISICSPTRCVLHKEGDGIELGIGTAKQLIDAHVTYARQLHLYKNSQSCSEQN